MKQERKSRKLARVTDRRQSRRDDEPNTERPEIRKDLRHWFQER
jgi:hypothetical protein